MQITDELRANEPKSSEPKANEPGRDTGPRRYRTDAVRAGAFASPDDQGPHQLAQAVGRALSVSGPEVPSEAALGLFFAALYEASFKAEGGGAGLPGRIVWQSRRPAPPRSLLSGPEPLRLARPVPLTAASAAAFFAAAPPPSALLVSAGETSPVVIQGILPGGDAAPALLRVRVLGPAHLKVEAGLDYPLELRRNRLRVSTRKVLERGLVRARLSALFGPLFPAVQALLPPDVASSPLLSAGSFPLPGGSVLLQEQDWPETLEALWVQAVALLLRGMEEGRREERRGGCLLLGFRPAADGDWALPPHGAAFSGLREALERGAAGAITQQVQAVEALSARAASPRDLPPDDAALHETRLSPGTLAADPAVIEAVRVLASLAHGDGPLRLDPFLDLISFGGLPPAPVLPERVYLAGDEAGSDLAPISSRSFGPRNQALLGLCLRHPEAVGFALTQDGDLRAMLAQDGDLIVWDSVLLPRVSP